MNKYAFGGGATTAFGTHPAFEQFPTGLPPFLGVSTRATRLDLDLISVSFAFYSSIPAFLGTDCGITFRFGISLILR